MIESDELELIEQLVDAEPPLVAFEAMVHLDALRVELLVTAVQRCNTRMQGLVIPPEYLEVLVVVILILLDKNKPEINRGSVRVTMTCTAALSPA